ncbi:AAA family ATPase [Teichococcus wenyumeiae]|uniref:AAA family ATPase n=1 Tax=Teichococcus wenyumeiae TaxID=2478470 RepID=UPI001F408F6B|nr:AAA family ATPase [Pseudoroseomonas wenyumeiae]
MSNGICDICGVRPATVQTQVVRTGQHEVMELGDVDYRRLARQQRRPSSPLGALFGGQGGSLFEEFFGGSPFGAPGSSRVPEGEDEVAQGGRGERQVAVGTSRPRSRSGAVTEHLSSHAEESLQNAARQATDAGRREVDTEQLLMALISSDMVHAVLERFKLPPDELARQLIQENQDGKGAAFADDGDVSLRVKDALSRAFAASRDLGHSYDGPEYPLIGLAEEGGGMAADVLRRYGATPQALRQQIVKVVGRGAEGGCVDGPTNALHLDKYSRDLTKLTQEGKLNPVLGRAQEIETTIEVLARRKKNNPVFIGGPGVGKAAIVEGLARHMIAGEVPEAMRDQRLVEISINSMVAGSRFRREFEERIQQILKEAEDQKDRLILFISEIHTIMVAGQGGCEGGLDEANALKPALASGELNLIGAPLGYVGCEEGGRLMERIRRRPYSVVLHDEIKKAHPDVHNVPLQLFDDECLTDGKGWAVDFTNLMLIATSNLGANLTRHELREEAGKGDDAKLKHDLMDVLRDHFRPEFINRVDEIIVLHALGRQQIRSIVELQLELVVRIAREQRIGLVVDASLIDNFALTGFRPEFGAREMRRQIHTELETQLARAMLGTKCARATGWLPAGTAIRSTSSWSRSRCPIPRQRTPTRQSLGSRAAEAA